MSCIENHLDSIQFNTTQSIHSRSYPFTITTTDTDYEDGAPVCIKNINYSYGCLGLVLPMTYSLCGKEQIFDTDCNSLCNCLKFDPIGLPDALQEDLSTTLNTIAATITIAESVFSATTINEKLFNAYRAVISNSVTAFNSSEIVNLLINQYITSTPSDLGTALYNLSNGIIALNTALQFVADLSASATLTSAEALAVIDELSNNLYDPDPSTNSSIEYLSLAINSLIALNISQESVDAANTALSLIPAAISAINYLRDTPNPTWNDIYSAILAVYNVARYTQLSVYSAADTLGNNVIKQFAISLSYNLFSSLFALCSATCLNQSLSLSETAQICALDNSAQNAIISARYASASIQFTNFDVGNLVPFYRDFNSCVSTSCCNKIKCLCSDCNCDYKSLLFHQTIYSLHVCNLNICISGTIGYDCFEAKVSSPYITSLKDIGFKPFVFDGTLCIPKCISDFTLRENFKPSFDIQCISPSSNYSAMNGPILLADIFSQVDLKVLLNADSNETSCP